MKRRNLPGFAILFFSVALATWVLLVTSSGAYPEDESELRDRARSEASDPSPIGPAEAIPYVFSGTEQP